jgi:hypothetical protein
LFNRKIALAVHARMEFITFSQKTGRFFAKYDSSATFIEEKRLENLQNVVFEPNFYILQCPFKGKYAHFNERMPKYSQICPLPRKLCPFQSHVCPFGQPLCPFARLRCPLLRGQCPFFIINAHF